MSIYLLHSIILRNVGDFSFINGMNIYSGFKFRELLKGNEVIICNIHSYSSNHRVLYTIEISMTRRFQKSVGPSVRL